MKTRILDKFKEIQIAIDNNTEHSVLRDIILVNISTVHTLLSITDNRNIVFANKLLELYHEDITKVSKFDINKDKFVFTNIDQILSSLGYQFNIGI